MRVPIAYALHHPDRVDLPVRPLDLAEVGALTFEPVDVARVPGAARWHARRRWPAAPRRASSTRRTRSPCTPSSPGACRSSASPRSSRTRSRRCPRSRCGRSRRSTTPTARRATVATDLIGARRVSWLLAFAGFAALIILHELGHFTAAKAVGMRVEKFSLFFGRPLLGRSAAARPSTAVGWIPARGLREDHRDEPARGAARRRWPIARTSASPCGSGSSSSAPGPLVNFVIAFLILWVLLLGQRHRSARTGSSSRSSRARRRPSVLRPGDRVVAVDGKHGRPLVAQRADRARTAAPGARPTGARPRSPAEIVVVRDGQRRTVAITPALRRRAASRPRVGFSYAAEQVAAGRAARRPSRAST